MLRALGYGLFLVACVLFFVLPGEAPSSRAKRQDPPSAWPWVLWTSLSIGSALAFRTATRLKEQEGRSP